MATESRSLPALDCACASVRRAARLITQLYSNEMGASVEPTQFALLSALSQLPGATQSPLGRALGLDKTTLSRNLRVLEKKGWIKPSPSDTDRRERGYRLTSVGRRALNAANSRWLRAQDKLRKALPPGEWSTTLEMFDRAAEAAVAVQRKRSLKNRRLV